MTTYEITFQRGVTLTLGPFQGRDEYVEKMMDRTVKAGIAREWKTKIRVDAQTVTIDGSGLETLLEESMAEILKGIRLDDPKAMETTNKTTATNPPDRTWEYLRSVYDLMHSTLEELLFARHLPDSPARALEMIESILDRYETEKRVWIEKMERQRNGKNGKTT